MPFVLRRKSPLCDAARARNGIAGSSFKSIQMINNGKKPAFKAVPTLSEILIQESLTARDSNHLLQIYCTVAERTI